jgi:protein-S-isoprenylcysteine O-methyltransferase Ste14
VEQLFNILCDLTSLAVLLAIAGAVVHNFHRFKVARTSRVQRSPVATCSMSLFAVLFYLTMRFHWSSMLAPGLIGLRAAGLILMIWGAIVNLQGRKVLADNWSDHVRIYADHELIQTGPFRYVRHPLYASLIWIFIGASLSYCNPLALAETLFLFLPAMHYRAHLEEQALRIKFADAYPVYCRQTNRFFPRWSQQCSK